MTSAYHEGELEVQRRAGVEAEARRTGGVIRSAIPSVARTFLSQQPMVVVGSLDAQGQPWASILAGTPGFLQALDERTVHVHAIPPLGDPLAKNLVAGAPLGLLAIEFVSRRRAKLKGRVELASDGFLLHVDRVYALCPKYIQAREVFPEAPGSGPYRVVEHSGSLSAEQQDWIRASDTFFIVSFHSQTGADASHRGGLPGFVQVESGTRLRFPDYVGNKMFNTLGNLAVNPAAGLLFIDFDRGRTLQLAGTASVLWDRKETAGLPGAERVVEFRVKGAIQASGALPLRWRFLDYSPAHPR